MIICPICGKKFKGMVIYYSRYGTMRCECGCEVIPLVTPQEEIWQV